MQKSIVQIGSEALKYIISTDEQEADLYEDTERADAKCKEIFRAQLLLQDGTVAEREALAGTSKAFKEAEEEKFKIIGEHRHIKNARASSSMRHEWARSILSARKSGINVPEYD